jgi:hypothetical protein
MLWEKKEQPDTRTSAETAKAPKNALAAGAVGRRVMMETPDPKADFAVNLPRTGALRNHGNREPTAIGPDQNDHPHS